MVQVETELKESVDVTFRETEHKRSIVGHKQRQNKKGVLLEHLETEHKGSVDGTCRDKT